LFVFSLGVPLLSMMIIGLFWKRNSTAAFCTMVISVIASFIWEYSALARMLGMPGWFGTTYLNLVIAIVFGVGLTAVLPGEKGFMVKKRVASSAQNV